MTTVDRLRTARVVFAGRPGTLPGMAPLLRRRGYRVVRAPSTVLRPVRLGRPPVLPSGERRGPIWLVTSRAVAEVVWPRNPSWHSTLRAVRDVVAVGPATASALRGIGVRARRPGGSRGGARALLPHLGPLAGRRVIYLRSDRAGEEIAALLRARGARVFDRVAYRTALRRRRGGSGGRALAGARAWIVASPSALDGVRAGLGRTSYGREIRRVELFALGPRTARAARQDGARRVRVPPRSTGADFTRFVAERLGDARA